MIPMLAIPEVTNNEVVMSALALFLGHHFLLRRFIRQEAGVKETSTTEISGQPLHFVKDEQPMTVAAHAAVCGKLDGRVVTLEKEVKEIRSKMEKDKIAIIEAGEDRATKIHDRINLAIEKIGELRGEVNRIAKV